jgi:hypothetical protein
MALADPVARRLISTNLCRFDLEPFAAMADDIDSAAGNRFLNAAG